MKNPPTGRWAWWGNKLTLIAQKVLTYTLVYDIILNYTIYILFSVWDTELHRKRAV